MLAFVTLTRGVLSTESDRGMERLLWRSEPYESVVVLSSEVLVCCSRLVSVLFQGWTRLVSLFDMAAIVKLKSETEGVLSIYSLVVISFTHS